MAAITIIIITIVIVTVIDNNRWPGFLELFYSRTEWKFRLSGTTQ